MNMNKKEFLKYMYFILATFYVTTWLSRMITGIARMANISTYSNKLSDPRWFNKRNKIKSRDNYCCQVCASSKNLVVHHRYYDGFKDPWDYEDDALITLCQPCHELEGNKVRATFEEKLLIEMRKIFLVPELVMICSAFETMKKSGSSYLIAAALSWILKDQKKMAWIINRYLKNIVKVNDMHTLKGFGDEVRENHNSRDNARGTSLPKIEGTLLPATSVG